MRNPKVKFAKFGQQVIGQPSKEEEQIYCEKIPNGGLPLDEWL